MILHNPRTSLSRRRHRPLLVHRVSSSSEALGNTLHRAFSSPVEVISRTTIVVVVPTTMGWPVHEVAGVDSQAPTQEGMYIRDPYLYITDMIPAILITSAPLLMTPTSSGRTIYTKPSTSQLYLRTLLFNPQCLLRRVQTDLSRQQRSSETYRFKSRYLVLRKRHRRAWSRSTTPCYHNIVRRSEETSLCAYRYLMSILAISFQAQRGLSSSFLEHYVRININSRVVVEVASMEVEGRACMAGRTTLRVLV